MTQSYDTKQLQKLDSAHFLHPFTDPKSLAEQGSRVITRAEGVYLWDSDGKRYLDGMAGLWCVKKCSAGEPCGTWELPLMNSDLMIATRGPAGRT